MNVLVTGATGFVGGHLVERLLKRGDRVSALVAPEKDASKLEARGVTIVRGDLRDASAVERAVGDGVERIFHLAGVTGGDRRPSRRLLRVVNVEATAILARAAADAGVRRFVLCSTAGVYGVLAARQVVDEGSPPRPDTPYHDSKVAAEKVARECVDRRGLPLVIARLTGVLGPGALSWQPLFEAIATRRFRLIGRGDNYHHVVDVADAADGLLLCGTAPGIEGRDYILAGAEPVRLRDLVDMIAEMVGSPPPTSAGLVRLLQLYGVAKALAYGVSGLELPRADRVEFFLSDGTFDITRARRDLGYAPRLTTREAVRRTAEWFASHGCLGGGSARAAT